LEKWQKAEGDFSNSKHNKAAVAKNSDEASDSEEEKSVAPPSKKAKNETKKVR
jgi:hypothetical protein